jgi:hypothetical protein
MKADGVIHGFLLRWGKFYPIDYPSATSIDVNWINPRGENRRSLHR